jgi:hypothetical protein
MTLCRASEGFAKKRVAPDFGKTLSTTPPGFKNPAQGNALGEVPITIPRSIERTHTLAKPRTGRVE